MFIKTLCVHKGYVCFCWCVWVFVCVLTSSRASLAALSSLSAGHVQHAHVRHLDSGSSLSYQLPGSLSQLSPPLCIPLLHTQICTKKFQWLLYVKVNVWKFRGKIIKNESSYTQVCNTYYSMIIRDVSMKLFGPDTVRSPLIFDICQYKVRSHTYIYLNVD